MGWAWNVFDLLLVGVQLLEELLMALSGGGDVGALCLSMNVNIPYLYHLVNTSYIGYT